MILLDRQTDPRPTNLPTSNPSNLKDPTVPSILSFLNGMKRATGTGVNAIQLGLLEAWKTGGSRRSIEQKRTATSGKKAENTADVKEQGQCRARRTSAAQDPRDPPWCWAVSGAPCLADDDDGVPASWTAPAKAGATVEARATADHLGNLPAPREGRRRSSVPGPSSSTRPGCCSCEGPRSPACNSRTGSPAIRQVTRTACPASFQAGGRSRSTGMASSR